MQLRLPLEVEGAAFELAVTLGGDRGLTSIEGDDENDAFDATADEDGVID